MRAVLLADVHIRRDSIQTDRKLLRKVVTIAEANSCPYIICVGDLIHEKQGLGVEQLTMLYGELKRSRDKGIWWVWVRGNHEVAIKSEPETSTPMWLFQDVARVVIKQEILQFDDTTVAAFLPWYRAHEFVERARTIGDLMRQHYDKRRILFAHIGLDEGRASASNMYINQGVGLLQIMQQHYDLVVLGDYHPRQWLSDRALYLGLPISREHGDDLDNGVWLLDTGMSQLYPIPFERGEFPQHRIWKVDNPNLPVLLGFDPNDHNRIIVPAGYRDSWHTLYPSAQVVEIGSPIASPGIDRLAKCHDRSPSGIWEFFCGDKSLDTDIQQIGKEILTLVAERDTSRG